MSPSAIGGPGRLAALALITLVVAAVVSCGDAGTGQGGVSVTFRLTPAEPAVGTCRLEVSMFSPSGQAVEGADARVEANMDHAGMVPGFCDLTEAGAGRYSGDVEFTMGGDWFLLLEADLADGTRVERRLDVPGVASP